MKQKITPVYMMTVIFFTAVLFIGGCTAKYGRLESSPELTAGITDGLELPDLNYYSCGRENIPYAVVGIDPAYAFQDKLWNKIETKSEVKEKIANLMTRPSESVIGSNILDSSGKSVGIWFSYYRQTTVEVSPDKKVTVYNPYRGVPKGGA